MGKWKNSFLLLLLFSFFCVVGCAHTPPPLFQPDQYPEDLYYIGIGIVINENSGQAREEAKLKAKEDLISQLTHSTVTAHRRVQVTDDGRTQQTIFEETINETFIQEVEGVAFIEESFLSKGAVQTTRAILSKQEWEIQKLTKIERERNRARAILSERYPDMPAPNEIVVLNRLITTLQEGIWGALVEDRFDGTFGNVLDLAKARLNNLYPQILQSARVYRTHEGTSILSQSHAKDVARGQFVSYLVNRLITQYSTLRIRYAWAHSEGELRAGINEYVYNFMNKHPSLLEYIPGPDSHDSFWQVFAVVSQSQLDEALNKDIDDLYLQVLSLTQGLKEEKTVTAKLAYLAKIRFLLDNSFIGLTVEDELFGYGSGSLQALERNLIDSVQLIVAAPDSVQVGTQALVSIQVQSRLPLGATIPLTLQIKDSSHQIIREIPITLDTLDTSIQTIEVPGKEKSKEYTVTCSWSDYPQKNASKTIMIAQVSLLTRIKNWLSKPKPALPSP
ncbi:MAG: hypothetical protein WC233_06135 [Sphaerochaeta sp.]|jgi:hypothetical protein